VEQVCEFAGEVLVFGRGAKVANKKAAIDSHSGRRMKNLERRRTRYLQDAIPIRLGGLAANLARIASFSKHPGHHDVVVSILVESKWFIEWTAAELEIQQAAELAELQLKLVVWELESQQNWNDENWRIALSAKASQWSQRILERSGLLSQPPR
jgi:hypothetical protein